jgi:hypothetical protein
MRWRTGVWIELDRQKRRPTTPLPQSR